MKTIDGIDKTDDCYIWSLKGNNVYIHNPKPQDFDIETIATVLSRICRFGGHTKYFYSVSQHSILLSNLMACNGYNKEYQLHALVHDAAEIFLGDCVKPVKYDKLMYSVYQPMEEKFNRVAARKFGYHYNKKTKSIIKYWENKLVLAEIRDLMLLCPSERAKLNFDAACSIKDLSKMLIPPEEAKIMFLRTYHKITKKPSDK